MKIEMSLRNKKGITLVEILLYLVLIGIVLQGALQIMIYGFNSYKTDYNFVQQENVVTNAVNALRKDIESASYVERTSSKVLTLNIPNSATGVTTTKVWSFDTVNNSLNLGTTQIVKGIDASKSEFGLDSGDERLILVIKPLETNKVKNKNRNFLKPIITEFSVKYKKYNII